MFCCLRNRVFKVSWLTPCSKGRWCHGSERDHAEAGIVSLVLRFLWRFWQTSISVISSLATVKVVIPLPNLTL